MQLRLAWETQLTEEHTHTYRGMCLFMQVCVCTCVYLNDINPCGRTLVCLLTVTMLTHTHTHIQNTQAYTGNPQKRTLTIKYDTKAWTVKYFLYTHTHIQQACAHHGSLIYLLSISYYVVCGSQTLQISWVCAPYQDQFHSTS